MGGLPDIAESIKRWDAANARALKAPGEVLGLYSADGRLFAIIKDKGPLDITDWFADAPPPSGAN